MSNINGRHKRPQNKKGVNKAVAISLLGAAGIAVPLMGAVSAEAASVDAWDKIAQCESSGLWNRPDGDGGRSSGGLQFQPASWNDAVAYLRAHGVDTSNYPQGYGHQAYKATKQQQIIAGEALLAIQGPGAWACNGMVGYPLQSSGPNSSMFRGGVNPYAGVPTTPKPTTPVPTTPKPTTPAPTTPAPVGGTKYTVVKGDTLYDIALAKKVNGGWKTLYAANESVVGKNPNLIYPNQVLTIPQPTVKYTVKTGDTLSGIAASYKVSGGWQKLYETNKTVVGDNPDAIQVGMVLVVSGGSASPSSPATPPSTPAPKPTTPAPKGYVAPLANMRVSQNFHNPDGGYGLGYHTGTDMSASTGTPVRAVSAGTIVHAGYGYAGEAYGNHIVLRLADGKYALYGHLSTVSVRTGQTVTAGQMIGAVGSTGNSSGAHLHFEIRNNPSQYYDGNFSDPITYLRSHGVAV